MNIRINLDEELQRMAEAKAAGLGVSLEQYVQKLVSDDVRPWEGNKAQRKAHVSEIFDLITDGPATDIAREKDELVGEAVWKDHLRKVGSEPGRVSPDKSR